MRDEDAAHRPVCRRRTAPGCPGGGKREGQQAGRQAAHAGPVTRLPRRRRSFPSGQASRRARSSPRPARVRRGPSPQRLRAPRAVRRSIHPGDAADKNLYDLPPEEDALIPTVCASLDEALTALDNDREFLTRGGVFSNDFIDSFIALKQEEVNRLRMEVHPVEFEMYYAI